MKRRRRVKTARRSIADVRFEPDAQLRKGNLGHYAGMVILGGQAEALHGPAAPEDPWQHRSTGMKCATCMWFVEKPGGKLGRCRRHAPTMNGFPAVYPADWCGDHKLDEHKA